MTKMKPCRVGARKVGFLSWHFPQSVQWHHETQWCFLSSIRLIDFISKKTEERNERGSIVSCSLNISSWKSTASHFWTDKVGTRFAQETWTVVQMPLFLGSLFANTWWSIIWNNLKPYVNTSFDYKGMFSRVQCSKRPYWNSLAIIPQVGTAFQVFSGNASQSVSWPWSSVTNFDSVGLRSIWIGRLHCLNSSFCSSYSLFFTVVLK